MPCFLANFVFKVICRPLVLKRKTKKTAPTRPKLNVEAQGQRGRKQATCMKSHFQKRERKEKKKGKCKPNWTILSCCILFCAEVFPSSSSLPFFPFLLFVFSPAHIHTIFTPYCPSLQSICAVLDLGRKRPFTHLGPAIQVPDNAPVSPE